MNSARYSTSPLSCLWSGQSIHIGYGPTDPLIIQTTIILTLQTVKTLATADVQIGPKLQKQ
jgi:hypothetical protein